MILFLAVFLAPWAGTAPRAATWEILFDGTSLDAWRGFGRHDIPASWRIENGALHFSPTPGRAGRGDLMTIAAYEDFELELEWKISEGGNSGIMFGVTEDEDQAWKTGTEMQVLDNALHPDGRTPLTSAGSNYALYAPVRDATRPVGEWNQVRIRVYRSRVQFALNGERVVAFDLWSDDWEARVRASKFATRPRYGRARSGHIDLQDHGDPVWYRNIRIRRLD